MFNSLCFGSYPFRHEIIVIVVETCFFLPPVLIVVTIAIAATLGAASGPTRVQALEA